jgi:hypothetical protein
MLKRATTLGRCTAMLLIALWAAQPLGAFVHSASHAHRFCPEHRTFEEAARGSGQLQAQWAERAPVLSSRAAALPDSGRPTHEECTLVSARSRQDALTSTTVTVSEACLASSQPATAPPSRGFPPLSVLATAPKSSPPARA